MVASHQANIVGVLSRRKGLVEIAARLSLLEVNEIYKAMKVIRGDRETKDIFGVPYSMPRREANSIVNKY